MNFLIALTLAIISAIIFSMLGLISGTDETAIMVPITLIVILLGAPPVAIFSFFIAAVMAKHLTHAIPTALMGVPGDTMATPMMEHANFLRRIGMPHIALRKMISGGVIGAFIALPIALIFAWILSPFGAFFQTYSGVIFTIAAIFIGYLSKGRWASVILIIPMAMLYQGLNLISLNILDKSLTISFFLGIAIGPMLVNLLIAISKSARKNIVKRKKNTYNLAPERKDWSGYFPNPFKVLSKNQIRDVSTTAMISSATFGLSPVGMTSMMGEMVGSRKIGQYNKATSSLAAMNGVTESTYIAETIIPLVAFGIPLSPVALGPAQALFNAPPVFTAEPINNLHNLMDPYQFLIYGILGLLVATLIAYPFSMNFARKATIFIMSKVNQEAIIAMFIGLVILLSFYEGGLTATFITFSIATVVGLLNRFLGMSIGVQFMIFYGSYWILSTLIGLKF